MILSSKLYTVNFATSLSDLPNGKFTEVLSSVKKVKSSLERNEPTLKDDVEIFLYVISLKFITD